MKIIIEINLYLSFIMLGIILITQIVNYPILKTVSSKDFSNFHNKYTNQISLIAGPIMIAELFTAILILFTFYNLLSIINLATVILILSSTIAIQVPIHNKLKNGKNDILINKLINSNCIRLVLWFNKCFISVIILNGRLL